MIFKIESKSNSKIKEILKLTKPSYSKEKGLYIAEGFHLLEMALESGLVDSVYSTKEIKSIGPLVPQYIINEEIMGKISQQNTSQGVLFLVKSLPTKEVTSNKVLYLDDVSDPGNLGTIFRTALAFGYSDIILSKNSCYKYNPKVVQASQGSIFKLNIVEEDNYYLPRLKNLGFKVVVTYLRDSIDIKDTPKLDKFILVLGNEARGVSDEVMSFADYKVRIDIENIESLNVAIAGAISMYLLK